MQNSFFWFWVKMRCEAWQRNVVYIYRMEIFWNRCVYKQNIGKIDSHRRTSVMGNGHTHIHTHTLSQKSIQQIQICKTDLGKLFRK